MMPSALRALSGATAEGVQTLIIGDNGQPPKSPRPRANARTSALPVSLASRRKCSESTIRPLRQRARQVLKLHVRRTVQTDAVNRLQCNLPRTTGRPPTTTRSLPMALHAYDTGRPPIRSSSREGGGASPAALRCQSLPGSPTIRGRAPKNVLAGGHGAAPVLVIPHQGPAGRRGPGTRGAAGT